MVCCVLRAFGTLADDVDDLAAQPVQLDRLGRQTAHVVDLLDVEAGLGETPAVVAAVIAQMVFLPEMPPGRITRYISRIARRSSSTCSRI